MRLQYKNILKFIAESPDLQQGLSRVVFVSAAVAFLYSFSSPSYLEVFPAFIYLIITFLVIDVTLQKKQLTMHVRKCLSYSDIIMTCYFMSLSGNNMVIGVMLIIWINIGYCFRYGHSFFKHGYVLGITSTVLSGYITNFITSDLFDFIGLMVGVVLIPLFSYVLDRKLNRMWISSVDDNRIKSNFINELTHEIRNSVELIINSNDLMSSSRVRLDQQDYVTSIKKSSELLKDLVNDVLDFSKIKDGKVQLKEDSFDLSTLLSDIFIVFKSKTVNKGLDFILDIEPDVESNLIGSKQHLNQVLNNLIGNAVKFTENGVIRLEVSTIIRYPNITRLRFKVIDSGKGIKAEHIGDIFKYFNQLDHDTPFVYGGSGLGTTISKKLVHLMGGTISVHSSDGIGSIFSFDIPFKITNVCMLDQKEKPFKLKSSGFKKSSEIRVLVADDEKINVAALRNNLHSRGYIVETAYDGEEVIAKLRQNNYDIIILDLNMNNESGLDIMGIFNYLYPERRTPFIILTGDSTDSTKQMCLDSGASVVLTKPHSINEVDDKITELVGNLE